MDESATSTPSFYDPSKLTPEEFQVVLQQTQARHAMRLAQIQTKVEVLKKQKSEAVMKVCQELKSNTAEASKIIRELQDMQFGRWIPPMIPDPGA